MYTIVIHSRRDETPDVNDALFRAVVSAISGQDATVLVGGKPLWDVEVNRHNPPGHDPVATIHFRGPSVEDLQDEVQRREESDIPF